MNLLNILVIIRAGIDGAINEVKALSPEKLPTKSEPEPEKLTGYPTPEAPAPTPVTQVPPPPTTSDTELDAEGTPWDERIHSGGKTKYAKTTQKGGAGTWTLKRGVDPKYAESIKAELRAASPAPVTQAPAPPTPPALSAATPDPWPGTPAAPPAPPALGTPAAPPAPGGPAAITSWGEFMRAVVGAGLSTDVVENSCAKFNVANTTELQNVPILIPLIAKDLGLCG